MKPPRKNLHMVLYIFSMLTLVSSESGTLKWNIVAHVQIPLTHSPIVWMRLLEVSARKQSFHIPTPHPEPNCEFSWARGKEIYRKKVLKKFSSTGIPLIKYIWSDAQKRKKRFVYCNLEALMEKSNCYAGQAIPAREIFVSNIVCDEGERDAICFWEGGLI